MTFLAAAHAVLALAAAIALVGSCGWVSYLLARRLLPGATASTRAAAAVGIAYWLLVADFAVLATLGVFRAGVAIPLWCLGALAAHRALDGGAGWAQARADVARAGRLGAAIRGSPLRWVLLVVAIVLVPVLLRGLVAPPLAWDALTYHLVKAARWVQGGDWAFTVGADAWGYYEYYPHGGDAIWAWAMLPTHGDALLALAGSGVWLSLLLGAYASARALGVAELRAVTLALAVGTLPIVFRLVTAMLVENTMAAVVLLALPLARRFADDARPADAALLLGAAGVAASIKSPGLGLIPLTLAWVAFESLRQRRGARALRVVVAVGAAAAVVGLPSYLRAFWDTGSPLYPLPLSIGGREIVAGNPELALLMARPGPPGESHWRRLVEALFFGHGFGFGALAPLALPLAGIGIARLARQPATRSFVAFAVALAALLAVPALLQPGLWIPAWAAVSVRLLLVSFAIALVCGSLVEGRVAGTIWLGMIAVGVATSLPAGFGVRGARAIGELLAAGFALAVVGLFADTGLRGILGVRPARIVAVLAALALFAIAWDGIRTHHRQELYGAASRGEVYDVNTAKWMAAAPVWRALDDGSPHRLAVVAGFAMSGHNAFVYPLFGGRLQNAVLYVPPTRDGAPLDYGLERDPWPRASRPAEWFERLAAQRVDVVVTLAPPPPVEIAWIRAHPERFERIACSRDEQSCAWRFVQPSAAR